MNASTLSNSIGLKDEWAAPLFGYGVFVAVLIFVLQPTFWEMAKTWATSSSYSHGIAVIPAALWMISKTRKPLSIKMSFLPLIGILAGSGLWLLGHAAGVALIEQIALITIAIAGVGVFFGLDALRQWAYPLTFLYFMVPFGESLLPYLQTMTAHVAVALLGVTGISTLLDGYMIETGAGLFEVAQACAGLRFLLAALMISAIFAHTALPTMKMRVIFLMIAVVVSLVANVVRAYLLILIATLSDMKLAVGADHAIIGLVFYAAVFALLFWIGGKLQSAPKPETTRWADVSQQSWRVIATLPAFIIICATSLYAMLIIDRTPQGVFSQSPALISAAGWRMLPPAQNWSAQLPNADTVSGATYQNTTHTVYVMLGGIHYDRAGHELVNGRTRGFDGDDWRKIGETNEVIYLFGSSTDHQIDILAGPQRRRLAVMQAWWWNGKIYRDPLVLKRKQMFAKLRGQNPPGGVLFIAAAFSRDPSEAVSAMRAFTIATEDANQWMRRMNGSP